MIFFFCDPLIGVACEPVYPFWVPTLHTEGLQQSEVSSVQPASLRLRWVHVSAVSVCFRTPRLSLVHPGSFKSAHVLKCMRIRRLHPCLTSLAEDVALPRDRVVHPYPSCTMPRPGIEPGLVDGDPEILTTRVRSRYDLNDNDKDNDNENDSNDDWVQHVVVNASGSG